MVDFRLLTDQAKKSKGDLKDKAKAAAEAIKEPGAEKPDKPA
jgi:hypothetical protein